MVLRVGLAGLGSMGRHHARVLASMDGVELVVAADEQGDKYRAAQRITVVETVEALIDFGIDYAVIALPTASHLEAAVLLAAARVPTLIEKPLANNVDEAGQIVKAFADSGTLGAVGHIERYNPALQECRRRLAHGELGLVYQVATRRQGPFPERVSDVGVVQDLATHDIDLSAWITNQSYQSVSARTAHRSGRTHEDLVAVTGMLSGGIVANHLVNWLSPFKERVTLVTGEYGAFVADTISADLTFFENGIVQAQWDELVSFRGVTVGNVTRFAIAKPEPLRTEHEAFRDAVLGHAAADIVTLDQGFATVYVADAVLTSARSGTTVNLSSGALPEELSIS